MHLKVVFIVKKKVTEFKFNIYVHFITVFDVFKYFFFSVTFNYIYKISFISTSQQVL